MPRRYDNTFLTKRQVEVLRLRAQGLSIEEIARVLGISKADVSVILRKAEKIVERARNTLRLYIEILNGLSIDIRKGERIREVLNKVFMEADLHGLKLAYSRADLLVEILKNIPNCVDLESETIVCNLRLVIDRNGVVRIYT